MPSSTSNSNERLPAGSIVAPWVWGTLIALVILGSSELLLRSKGVRPLLKSDATVWGVTLDRLRSYSKDDLAILGTSRVKAGIDLVGLRNALGRTPAQLGINGTAPLELLRYFSEETSFRGLLICELTEMFVFERSDRHERRAREYIDTYKKWSLTDRLEAYLRVRARCAFVYLRPDISPILGKVLQGKPVPAKDFEFKQNRSDHILFPDPVGAKASELEVLKQIENLSEKIQPASEMEGVAAKLSGWVRRIRDRGGQVVFLRMPSGGLPREAERRRIPRSSYWDVLARRVDAIWIHYEDYPELASFTCPDGAHLSYPDAQRFTRLFTAILLRRLPGAP